jgi:hypothetical protein
MEENFDHLEGWDLLVESRQYRGQGGKNLDLRTVADFAFLDLIATFILSNEYEFAPIAANYADKTMFYRNFNKARLSGTDLYTSLNILSNSESVFSRQIKQNLEADEILRRKLNLQLPTVKRYLDLLAGSSMRSEDAQVLLLRLEKQLNITDSKLKSIRRLAQQWPSLTTMQRDLVVQRMLQFYKKNAKRSEMMHFLEDMGKQKGFKLNGPVDAEMKNLGLGGIAKALGPVAAAAAAYHLGKSKPKNIDGFGKDIYGKWR